MFDFRIRNRPPASAAGLSAASAAASLQRTGIELFNDHLSACDEGPGLCAHLITFLSVLLVFVTMPFSLCFAVKVVQEYERVVIFRLGRLLSGGARGPGIFFIVPCVDSYQKVDMRTLTFDVPPQEVFCIVVINNFKKSQSFLANRRNKYYFKKKTFWVVCRHCDYVFRVARKICPGFFSKFGR